MTVCSMTQSKVKVISHKKLDIRPFSMLVFSLVFVSRAFEVGKIVSCEESTASPVRG